MSKKTKLKKDLILEVAQLQERVKELEASGPGPQQSPGKSLHESEIVFQQTFEYANTGICLVDLDGRLFEGNQAMSEIFGYSTEELEHIAVDDIAHPDDVNISPTFISKAINGEVERTTFEKRYFHKEGHLIWCQVSSRVVRDQQGSPRFFISTVQDITDRVNSEQRLLQKRVALSFISILNHAANTGAKLKEIIALLNVEIRKLHPTDQTTVYLYNDDKTHLLIQEPFLPELFVRKIEKIIKGKIPPVCFRIKKGGLYHKILQSNKPHITHDPAVIRRMMEECTEDKKLKAFIPLIAKVLDLKSVVSIPLVLDGEVLGLIDLASSSPFPESFLDAFETISEQVTALIQRNRLNEQLQANEKQYLDIFYSANDLIQNVGPDGKILQVNKKWLQTMGYSKDEVKGLLVTDILREDQIAPVKALLHSVIQGKKVDEFNTVFLTKSGREIHVEGNGNGLFEGGKLISAIGVFRDITERIKVENELKIRAEILDNMDEGINLADENGIIYHTNPRFEVMFGYQPGEMLGKHVSILNDYPPDENEALVNKIFAALKTEGTWSGEITNLRKDGTQFICSARVSSLDVSGKQCLISVQHDITERKQAEEKLQESENKYRALYEDAPLPYHSLDEKGCIIDVNPAWIRSLGYEEEQVMGKWFGDFLHPDWKPIFEKNFPLLKKRGFVSNVVYKIKHQDGHYLDISLEGCAGHYTDGKFKHTYCVFQDITERIRAEIELHESEEKFRILYNNSPDMYVSVSPQDGSVLLCNETLLSKTGFSKEDVIGCHVHNLYDDDCLEEVKEVFQEFIEKGIILDRELLLKRKDGGKIYVSLNVDSVRGEEGEILYSISSWRDITERKKTEDELRLTQFAVDNLRDAAYWMGSDAKFIYVNDAMTESSGYSREELLTMTIHDINPEFAEEGWADHWAELNEKKTLVINTVHQRKDESTFPVEVTLNLIQFGKKQINCAFAKDITNRVQIEREKDLLLNQVQVANEHLKNLSRELINSQEAERKRISQELHDELGQAMTAISLDLGIIELKIDLETDQEIRERLNETRAMADELSNVISELALDLRPSLLDDLGLLPTLNWYTDRYSKRAEIEIKKDFIGMEDRIPIEMETALYRVFQEALTNVARHGQANSVILRLDRTPTMMTASIEDDGMGFDLVEFQSTLAPLKSVGLAGMNDRISLIGGSIKIHTKPGEGTRIEIEIPL